VRRILKFPGDPVKAGDTLAELESADLGQAQSAVLAARAHAEAANANEKRESQLAEARVSSQRDAELARATAASARADLHAAEQRVRALGGSASSEIGILLVTSPIPGKIVESHVSRGQSVEPSATLFRVADLERVWIELAVFERELGHISPSDPVEISPQTNLSVVLKGSVAHVGDIIDRETRSGDVRVVVANPAGSLRPGQSVLAKIHTKTTPSAVLLLPRDAVTSVDGKPTVFVEHDATSVEPRSVTTGARDGARVEITAGLAAGERVAISGVFALKSEIFR
jgi:cobalt-zinc-cadmium efflux system membrane fusion protein